MEHSVPVTLETPRGTLVFNGSGDSLVLSGFLNADSAQVRSVVESKPQADGAHLGDFFRGALYPVLEGQIVASSASGRRALEDQLRAYCDSLLRSDGILRWTPSGADTRRRTVRLLEGPQIQGGWLKTFQIALVSPDPPAYSDTEHSEFTLAESTEEGGWGFPFAFPFSFGNAITGGAATITNGGNAPSFPVVRFHPTSSHQNFRLFGPQILNQTTDKMLSLVDLEVLWGSYAEVDMLNQTITMNGDPSSPLDDYLDVVNSEFWALEPGDNEVVLLMQAFNAAAGNTQGRAEIIWRDAYAG